MNRAIEEELDHLFRRQSGKIVASLTRLFGPDHLDLAESVVQDALLKAVQSWPLHGLPQNPAAWITQVAKNQALDMIRRDRKLCREPAILDELGVQGEPEQLRVLFEDEINDDTLKLIFVCCHPVLTREARVALTLKTLCGLSVSEIARAFLAQPETIAQRLVRAKQKIRDEKVGFEVPAPDELEERLDSVLDALYLLFNEGYSAHEGADLLREELCEEAIRLAHVLSEHRVGARPKVYALLSLMSFQASRFKTRTSLDGEILLLEEQDRSLWDKELIAQGMYFLERSAEGQELSEYHLQAGIAAAHATAPTFGATNWKQIVSYYDLLLELRANPVVELNRAVAVAMSEGFEAALLELRRIAADPKLKSYALLPATFGEIYRRMGKSGQARPFFEQALKLTTNETERKHLSKRLRECAPSAS